MPSFNYVALNKNGKRVKGTLEASSIDMARTSLRGTGYTVMEIAEQSPFTRKYDFPFLGNPKAKDLALFCRQFTSILRAGVPVAQVLTMLSQQQDNKKLQKAIRMMQVDVEKGDTLAAAMRRHPKIFSNMLVNMVAAGEESGNLENAFSQMEIYFDKMTKTKNSVVRAMIYPIILIIVMIVVLFVMMTRIIPRFLETFNELNVELPALTKGVMAVSYWFVDWWWLLAIIILVLVIGGAAFGKTNAGKHFFGWISRHFPIVKLLTVRSACATFCRTMSLLISSGLTITEAMDLAAANMQNIWFEEAVLQSRQLISQGWTLAGALDETRLFPPMVVNMVSIGEESGDLQDMMAKTADYYDEEVENATQRLLAMMEPAIILFMAVFVVIIVLSIFLPMLSMTQAYDQYLQ